MGRMLGLKHAKREQLEPLWMSMVKERFLDPMRLREHDFSHHFPLGRFLCIAFFYRLSWAFFSKGPPNSSTRSAASGGKYNIIIQASPLEGFSENFTTPSTGCLPF